MGKKAFNVLGLIKNGSLFATEYKNHAYAIAEVIDNALDAGADHVVLYLRTKKVKDEVIFELYSINNGKYIEYDKIDSVLTYGFSDSYKEYRTGKYGVGFKQALFSMCKRIDLYSIKDLSYFKGCKSYFDTKEMLEINSDEIPSPFEVNLFDEFANTHLIKILQDLLNDGWKECVIVKASNFDFKKIEINTFKEELELNLGRIFRYFLTTSDYYYNHNIKKLKLSIIANDDYTINVRPQDPLFLMEDDKYLLDKRDYENPTDSLIYGIPLFNNFYTDNKELTTLGKWELDKKNNHYYFSIDYKYEINNKVIESKIIFKAALVKKTFVSKSTNRGATMLGKIAQSRDSISFVRYGREIDFGTYSLYNNKTQRVQDRFWNIEIIFDDNLDNHLGITNNKQKISLYKTNVDIDGKSIFARIKEVFDIFACELRKVYNSYVCGIRTVDKKNYQNNEDIDNKENVENNIIEQNNQEVKEKNNIEYKDNFESTQEEISFSNISNEKFLSIINDVNRDFECQQIYYKTIFRKNLGLIFCKARMYNYPFSFQLRIIDPITYNIKNGIELTDDDLKQLSDAINKYFNNIE